MKYFTYLWLIKNTDTIKGGRQCETSQEIETRIQCNKSSILLLFIHVQPSGFIKGMSINKSHFSVPYT